MTAFDGARRPRCQRIARTGAMVARMGADVGGGWRQAVRNALVRIARVGLVIKAGEPIVGWSAP